jgi:hypothetical protein
MILTDGNTLTLELDGAAGTTEPRVVSFCRDTYIPDGSETYTMKETTTTGDTHVHIAADKGNGYVREVEEIYVYNHSTTASNTFEVKLTGGTTDPISLAKFTLLTLEMAVYNKNTGWKCYKATGALKTST